MRAYEEAGARACDRAADDDDARHGLRQETAAGGAHPAAAPAVSLVALAAACSTGTGQRARDRAAEPALGEEGIEASLDDLNRDSPLQAVFFQFDSAEISPEGQSVLTRNADVLKKYATWAITVEGHCDERGTADTTWRSANGVRWPRRTIWCRSAFRRTDPNRQLRQGISVRSRPQRAAFSKNRRAHFVITAK